MAVALLMGAHNALVPQMLHDPCAALDSCESCTSQGPPAGIDLSVRCVWCPSKNTCEVYHRHTFDFPCDDAIRHGGGYPGGERCSAPYKRPKAAPAWVNNARPTWGERFSYEPVTDVPVSVIIPSFSRMSNLPFGLAWLLRLEPLLREGSEIIVSHGSRQSFEAVHAMQANLTIECNDPTRRACADDYAARVRHIDNVKINKNVYVAQRYFAARSAANAVLLHVDDDIVPGEAMLQALIDRVASEPGFPSYAEYAPGLYGPSGLGRYCSQDGYTTEVKTDKWIEQRDAQFLSSQLTATSSAANAIYLERFETDYAQLLHASGGNGEDLTFARSVGRVGPSGKRGVLQPVGSCSAERALAHHHPRGWRDACATREMEIAWVRGHAHDEYWASTGQYHTRADHYEAREAICKCLHKPHYNMGKKGYVGAELRDCALPDAPKDDNSIPLQGYTPLKKEEL